MNNAVALGLMAYLDACVNADLETAILDAEARGLNILLLSVQVAVSDGLSSSGFFLYPFPLALISIISNPGTFSQPLCNRAERSPHRAEQ